MNRRAFLSAVGAGALAPLAVGAEQQAQPVPPEAPRDWSGRDPVRYPDPDVIALDPRFRRYMIGNTPIRRLQEGAARIGQGELNQPITIKTGDEANTLCPKGTTVHGRNGISGRQAVAGGDG